MICSKHYSGSYNSGNVVIIVGPLFFKAKGKIKKKVQLVASSRGIQKLQSLILGSKRYSGWGLGDALVIKRCDSRYKICIESSLLNYFNRSYTSNNNKGLWF